MIPKIVNKLKSINDLPKWVQKIITVATCIMAVATVFFASMYSYFREITPAELAKTLSMEASDSAVVSITSFNINYTALWAICIIISSLLSWGIFELISRIVYKNLKTRRQISGDTDFYRFVMRLGFITCNLLIGLFSLLYFFDWSKYIIIIGTTVFDMLVRMAVYTLVFLILANSVLFGGTVAAAYKRLVNFFCILLGVLCGYSLLINVLPMLTQGFDTTDIVTIVCLAVEVLIIVGYYFLAKLIIRPRLLKLEVATIRIVPSNNNNVGGFDFDAYFNSASGSQSSRRSPFENEDPFAGSESAGKHDGGNENNQSGGSSSGGNKKDDDEIFKGFGF